MHTILRYATVGIVTLLGLWDAFSFLASTAQPFRGTLGLRLRDGCLFNMRVAFQNRVPFRVLFYKGAVLYWAL